MADYDSKKLFSSHFKPIRLHFNDCKIQELTVYNPIKKFGVNLKTLFLIYGARSVFKPNLKPGWQCKTSCWLFLCFWKGSSIFSLIIRLGEWYDDFGRSFRPLFRVPIGSWLLSNDDFDLIEGIANNPMCHH